MPDKVLYECPLFVDALLDYILNEIARVFWNANQKEWDWHDDPAIPGIEFRPYNWRDETCTLPNFKFGDVEFSWYKYPGRGMEVNVLMSEAQWRDWFDACIEVVREAEGEDVF